MTRTLRRTMSRLWQLHLVMPLISLAPSSRAFVPTTPLPVPLPERIRWPFGEVVDAATVDRLSSGNRRRGPRPLLASAQHDVEDSRSIILEMKNWARAITAETYLYTNQRSLQYLVSSGSSIPEVLFDFWKAVSDVIDEHRATGEDRSLRKIIMFVAPYCEELKDYQTMEHVHQLLQQSATVGGCGDFGTDITHLHYHPNYRYRPTPKEMRMASRHSPHPAFGIEVLYRTGGLKSLASMCSAPGVQGTEAAADRRPRPRTTVDSTPREGRFVRAHKKRDEWAAQTRSALEKVYYKTPASYGAEDAVAGSSSRPHHRTGKKAIPESSQEVLEITQAWLRWSLKDAAESDAVASKLYNCSTKNKAGSAHQKSPPSNASSSTNLHSSTAASMGDCSSERFTSALPEAGASFPDGGASRGPRTRGDPVEKASQALGFHETSKARQRMARGAGPGGQEVFAHASEEYVPVRGEAWRDRVVKGKKEEFVEEARELSCQGEERGAELPGKEMVKRMQNISQYIVARSKTAEEAFGDVWEVIHEMAERATARGCGVPTEDYSSRSSPCYGALFVTPDFATYSFETFSRFQDILNRGLRHLPMEHDISVEAFHPEAVSKTTPLDHRFTRSPFPTLHVCYHGLRARHSPLYPRAPRKAVGGTSSSRRLGDSKKRRN